jgi:hypothetical protein
LKRYQATSEVFAQIERALAQVRPHPGDATPLAQVAAALVDGRHYEAAEIYLAVDAGARPQRHATVDGATWTFSIRVTTREIGVLAVTGKSLSGADRVLLARVAKLLARFLTSRGKYLVRAARERAAEQRAHVVTEHAPSQAARPAPLEKKAAV